MATLTDWLLEGPAWIQYRTRIDLLKQKENHADVIAARQAMIADSQIRALVHDLADFPGPVLNSHKSAGHPLHQLAFLADIGLHADDPGIDKIIARIVKHQATEGPFQVLMNIPKHFGGSGKDEWAWALCDAPAITFSLLKFGLSDDARVQRSVDYLTGLVRENGFPCAVSKELGKFRGPGSKADPCPYPNLLMLKVFAQSPKTRNSRAAHIAAETLLTLWSISKKQHPYMFFMGTDFRKLKAPLVWYDILHVLDVLSQFSWLKNDKRLRDMASVVQKQADENGRFTPTSIWKAWDKWEFGQKKEPSRWVTLIAQRALKRIGMAA
ncbi:MAG: hypothetical protein HZB51_34700 [Chloroflexi bacterium]|nr:hypothetical protein [Chloroflexota bacterium]